MQEEFLPTVSVEDRSEEQELVPDSHDAVEYQIKQEPVGPRIKPPRAPIGTKLPCQICGKEFSNKYTYLTHLANVHKLIVENPEKVPNTQKECRFCGVHFANLSKHYRCCKKKKESVSAGRKEESSVLRGTDDVPKAFNSGGVKLIALWEKWILKQSFRKQTRYRYTRGIKMIIPFFEGRVKGFKADSVLFALDKKVMLPSLSQMVVEQTKLTQKKHLILAYIQLCNMVYEYFEVRYAADERFCFQEKAAFKSDIQCNQRKMSKQLVSINKQIRLQTQLNKAQQAKNPHNLSYNSSRLSEIWNYVCTTNLKVKEITVDLAKGTPDMLTAKYTEVELRNFLMSLLLVSGGGLRPSAVACMKIGELTMAKTVGNVRVAKVFEHKGFMTHGPQNVPFIMPLLYASCIGYMHTFRDPNNIKGYLFATSNGTSPRCGDALDWFKENLLKGYITEKEGKTLVPGSWRKGWTNWAQLPENSKVGALSTTVMGHSKKVEKESYLNFDEGQAVKFGTVVAESMVDNAEEDVYSVKLSKVKEGRVGFTKSERQLIKDTFKDGKAPTKAMIQTACHGCSQLQDIFNRVKSKKGERRAVRALRNVFRIKKTKCE